MDREGQATVGVCADSTESRTLARAEALASRLGVALYPCDSTDVAVLLAVTDERVEARQTDARDGPVFVEFERGAFGHRRAMPLRQEAVVRAVGFRGAPLEVVDMTAGLGRDAMVLAAAGCRVTALERHPVIFELLADGLERAKRDPDLAPIIEERLVVLAGDAVAYLKERAAAPDVVYLDPMFPARSGSAVSKKEIRLLSRLAGPADDADHLFESALHSGCRRVMVKRPRLAPPLHTPDAPKVGMRLEGRSSRFDIYFPTTPTPFHT